jgi:hypothetical protein
MPGIIYQRDKRSGSTYAYRDRKVLDERTGRVRTRREYIGRVDPSTGDIVPKAEHGRNARRVTPVAGEEGSVADLAAALRDRDEELTRLREQVLALSERNAALEGVVAHVSSFFAELAADTRIGLPCGACATCASLAQSAASRPTPAN